MNDFHFLRPLWLYGLLAVAAVIIFFLRAKRSSRSWAAVCDPQLLPFLLVGNKTSQRRSLAPWLIGIAGTLLVLALAGPAWERLPQPVFRDQSALIIALDLSRSMDVADLKPSRLTRALHKITDILKARQGRQTALLVYAGEAFTVSPLTDDEDTILALLPSLDTSMMPVQGSRADLALNAAHNLLQQAGITRGEVLLISDGIEEFEFAAQLDLLRKQGHRLHVLGVGTAEGAPIPQADGGFLKDASGSIVLPKLDRAALQRWARNGNGRYADIRPDEGDIQYLFSESTDRSLDQAEKAEDFQSDQWREQGPWLILLAVPFAALAFRRGILVWLLVLLIPLPEPAHAIDWHSLWSRPDQLGMRALQDGNAEGAAQQFEDPQWKATAQYRAGQYQQAANSLEAIETADALYNRGNALAKLGQYPQAMASYRRAIELNPGHEDAKHNLELLEQQQPQDSQTSKDDKQSENNQEKKQGENESDEATGVDQQQGESGESDPQSGENAENTTAEQDDNNQTDQPGQPDQPDQPDQQQAQSDPQTDTQESASEPAEPSGEPGEQQPEDIASIDQQDPENTSDPATEQWLRRIPDDPGGLLRRKFLYQYQQREHSDKSEDKPW